MAKKRKIQQHPRTSEYYVQVQQDGVRQHFSLGYNKKAAERRLSTIERDIAAGKIVFVTQETTATAEDGRPDIDLGELAVRHLQWVKANRADGTFKLRQHYVFQLLEYLELGELVNEKFEFTKSMKVSKLKRSQLTDMHTQARLQNPDRPNAGNQLLRNIKTMLLWGQEEELCELPFRKFPPISYAPAETKRVDVEDLVKLLAIVPQDFADLIQLGLLTGLRPKELRELTVDQVVKTNSDTWYIRIEQHKTAGQSKEAAARTVILSDNGKEIIERQIAAHPKSKHIFLNDAGNPYTRQAFRNRLIRWSSRAGIPDITPYALRHTFASLLSDEGVETTALSRLMGHSSVRTLARYVSNSREHDLQAVQKAESILDKALNRPDPEEE